MDRNCSIAIRTDSKDGQQRWRTGSCACASLLTGRGWHCNRPNEGRHCHRSCGYCSTPVHRLRLAKAYRRRNLLTLVSANGSWLLGALLRPSQRPRDGLHNSLRSVIARSRAVYCVVFLANSRAIGCKKRLVAHPDPHYHRLARVMQTIPGECTSLVVVRGGF